jgi:hypothetical protein
MSNGAEKELEAIRAIMDTLTPFTPRARQRILGYVKHFMRSPSAEKTMTREDK